MSADLVATALRPLVLVLAIGGVVPLTSADAAQLYATTCANCHGKDLQGASGPALRGRPWTYGGSDEALFASIRDGHPAKGMPSFEKLLSGPQIRSLVIHLQEATNRASPPAPAPMDGQVVRSAHHTFRLETVLDQLDTPWGLAWLADGTLLVTEKPGRLVLLRDGQRSQVRGLPKVDAGGQGGLLDVAVHPKRGIVPPASDPTGNMGMRPNDPREPKGSEPGADPVSANGWIYLSFSDPGPKRTSMTKLVRGRIRDGAWVDQETIFQAPPETYRPAGGVHFGSRIVFDGQGHVFLSIGERGAGDQAPDPARPNGKIHRLNDDGTIPSDNPYLTVAGALPSLWSLGHRNPQGLAYDQGVLWESEHGPRGGDEINRIEPGHDYGWPRVTFGMNYDGTPITDATGGPGITDPVHHWTPSIAVCGIAVVRGDGFPRWNGDLLATGLAGECLRRLRFTDGKLVEEEVLLARMGRQRAVAIGPDGCVYVAFNDPGRVVRLRPLP